MTFEDILFIAEHSEELKQIADTLDINRTIIELKRNQQYCKDRLPNN